MMNFDKITSAINEQGFVVVEDVVTEGELETLREQLDVALVDDMEAYGHLPGKQHYIIYDMVTRGSAFVQLLENKKMQAIFQHFLGKTCILYSFTSTVMQPDIAQPTINIHTDAPRIIPGYHSGMLMTLALDDFTEENGATYYLPGSQHRETPPSIDEFYDKAIRVTRKAGDAVFFNPRVWHAGGKNNTRETRRGLTPYAVRSFMRQRFDYPRMVSPQILEQLGETGRAFLGFNVRVPTSLEEYYVPADQRLYQANQG